MSGPAKLLLDIDVRLGRPTGLNRSGDPPPYALFYGRVVRHDPTGDPLNLLRLELGRFGSQHFDGHATNSSALVGALELPMVHDLIGRAGLAGMPHEKQGNIGQRFVPSLFDLIRIEVISIPQRQLHGGLKSRGRGRWQQAVDPPFGKPLRNGFVRFVHLT